jgi:hypothetical protein
MFHPLLENITKIKDQELENKIMDLTNKYHIAMRLGQGGVAQQIVITLEAYRLEQEHRRADSMKEIQARQKKQGLDDLVNVD